MNQAKGKSPKINVLVAADHGGYNGNIAGIGRNLSYILPNIDKNRFNLFLVILRDDGSLKARLAGTGIKIFHLKRKKFDPFILVELINIIKKENIHLLHLYQYGCSNFGRLAGKIMGVPTILNIDDLNYNYPWYQWIADRILRWANEYVIAVSEAVKNSGKKVRALDPDKIIVIPNAISDDHLKHLEQKECCELKKHWGIKEKFLIVGTITRLNDVKGNDILLEAAKIVLKTIPNTLFVFVGDGPLMEEMLNITKKFNIEDNVLFTGYQKDVSDFLSIFDVKVIASNSEGFPLACLEAMIMGKAMVATEVDGLKEILNHGVTGILVPPQNPEAMAEKIIYLLQSEHERKRLGTNALNESRRFTVDSHMKIREKVYEKAIKISRNSTKQRYAYD
jgi:glycosyltransferase involved in cell wall biosynthesis